MPQDDSDDGSGSEGLASIAEEPDESSTKDSMPSKVGAVQRCLGRCSGRVCSGPSRGPKTPHKGARAPPHGVHAQRPAPTTCCPPGFRV